MHTALEQLKQLPARIIHDEKLTTTEAEALELCKQFNREGVDAIVLHFATFPTGAMIPLIAQSTNVPIILFANPEEPEEGGIWSQNSFCGANMAAHVLHRMGIASELLPTQNWVLSAGGFRVSTPPTLMK